MKVNKIICDKCNIEMTTDTEVRLDVMKKQVDTRGYSLGFKKEKSIDLCEDCYKKLF